METAIWIERDITIYTRCIKVCCRRLEIQINYRLEKCCMILIFNVNLIILKFSKILIFRAQYSHSIVMAGFSFYKMYAYRINQFAVIVIAISEVCVRALSIKQSRALFIRFRGLRAICIANECLLKKKK